MAKKKDKSKETTESSRKNTSPEKTIGEMAQDIATSKKRTRQSDSKPTLPLRMFVRGHEPLKKKVNSYFSLNHLELVKKALEEDQIRKLLDSQFGTLLGIGNKIAFSMVVLACSPNVLTTESSTTGSEDEEPYSVQGVATKPINLYMPLVRRLDNDDRGRQGDVISIMRALPSQRGVEKLVRRSDNEDPSVDHMLTLIRAGGVKADDVFKPRKVEDGQSSHADMQKVIVDVADACVERVKTLNEEHAKKMQDMLDLAVTSIESEFILKFSALERMIEGMHGPPTRSVPTSNPHLSESSSDTTPDGNNDTHVSSDINVESPERIVRNVLTDLNEVAEEDLICGDRSIAEDEEFQHPEHVLEDTANGVEETDNVIDSHPIPLDEFPAEVWEEPVIILGHTGVHVVPEKDAEIPLPTTVDGESSKDVAETSVAEEKEDNVQGPPSFSLGLTQDLKKRYLFNQVYKRRSKRAKYTSTAFDDYVVDLPGKGKQCIVSAMFKPPAADDVELVKKLMENPSFFPTYHGHNLTEASFLELLVPDKITSPLVLKYDFLDYTFLNDIGLLHELIIPLKRRTRLPIKKQLCDYVKSRRNLYTEVDTLLCPFLLEDKHWVGVVVNLNEHALLVLDCNQDLIETPIVDALLTPFASALPYVTRQLAYNSEMRHETLDAFTITRPSLTTRLTDPGLSGIASIMLLLLYATKHLDEQIPLTRDQVESASQNYAVELFHTIMSLQSK
ncbi:unnamed protein product [Cochlearia groenlandica]